MRKPLVLSMAVLALLVVPVGAAASGGGGCGGPQTEAVGTSVAIDQFCFEPTVLYAASGEEITWTNQDPTRHDVLGANAAWGSFEALRPNATASETFDEPGVYPYVCTWHPGMSGAVVVGDGGLERLDIANVARVQAGGQSSANDEAASSAGTIALVAGVVLVSLFVLGIARRRGRGSTVS